MRCEWTITPLRNRKAGSEQCPNEARWEKDDESGAWHLCETHKSNYVNGMNDEHAKKEALLWRPI
jgi:hypothetical protein